MSNMLQFAGGMCKIAIAFAPHTECWGIKMWTAPRSKDGETEGCSGKSPGRAPLRVPYLNIIWTTITQAKACGCEESK